MFGLEDVGEMKSSWNPTILASAFDDAAWEELMRVAEAAGGKPLERQALVNLVAKLPWDVVTLAVSYGGGVPWKALTKAVGDAAASTAT